MNRAASSATLFAAVDCGTTAVKGAVFDVRGRCLALHRRNVRCRYGSDGRVEQDAEAVARAAFRVLKHAVSESGSPPASVAALSVTGQRATMVCLDGGGRPLGSAMSWQDLRSGPELREFLGRMTAHQFSRITGLPPDPVFSLGKLLLLKRREPERYRAAKRFVLVHDFILHALGAPDYVTDPSNASLTGLCDIARAAWSEPILAAAGLDAGRLPRIAPSAVRVGGLSSAAARRCGLLQGTPLVNGGGDQQCAAIGAGIVSPSVCSITLGTAGVVFAAVRRAVRDPRHRLMSCIHAVPGLWEVEGLQHAAGDSLDWMASLFATAADSRSVAARVARVPPGSNGVRFYPFLAGAGCPHWRPDAAGAFLGLRRAHGAGILWRAVLEGVAFENRRILEAIESLCGPIREIRLTGGYASLAQWERIHADVCGRPVIRLRQPQATLLGAAVLAATGAGAFDSVAEGAVRTVRAARVARPDPARAAAYDDLYRRDGKTLPAALFARGAIPEEPAT